MAEPVTNAAASTSSRASSPSIPIVQPDHFYGTEGIQLPISPRSDGKAWLDPDDDVVASRGIPVFKPSMEEFSDFEGFMKKIECWGMRSGIVKIIPPREWKEALPPVNDKLRGVKLSHPIEQHMIGRSGLFRQRNIETNRKLSVREWAEFCEKDDFRAPGVDELGHASRAQVPLRTRRSRKKTEPAPSIEPEAAASLTSPLATPVVPLACLDSESPNSRQPTPGFIKQEDKNDTEGLTPNRGKGKRSRTHAHKQALLAERLSKDEAWLDDFDQDADWLPPHTTAYDYTPDFCRQLERQFWRKCGIGRPAQYGADMAGSLFTDPQTPWNVAYLPSTLERIMPRAKFPTPGVNLPYLYFGMWRATFAWHVEDCDLFSINYIHFGAGKFWYAVPQARAGALETAMRGYFPEGPNACPQFLRHKAFLVSPTVLAQANCRPNTLVQHAGEFVVTYPRGYHAGFNLGFNCAESTNFALDSWLDLGRKAKVCGCIGDSVRIDVDALLEERAREQQEAERKTSGFSKDLDAAMHTLPILEEEEEESTHSVSIFSSKSKDKQPSRKRNADSAVDEASPSKKLKPSLSRSATSISKLVLKLGPRPPDENYFPCCLCASSSHEGLLPVYDRPRSSHPAYSSITTGQWMAHEACAKVIPETWVDVAEGSELDGNGGRAVFGVDAIVKDRWNLRCSACAKARAKVHGAPVQCTKGKCSKAFHVSCARDVDDIGFVVDGEVDKEIIETVYVDAVDGLSQPTVQTSKMVKKWNAQVLCAQHNPAVIEARKANRQDKLRQHLLSLGEGARVKVRVSSGVFEVSLVRVVEEEGTVEVLWDRGIKREFKWGSLILGDTDPGHVTVIDSQRARPVSDWQASPQAQAGAAGSSSATSYNQFQINPSTPYPQYTYGDMRYVVAQPAHSGVHPGAWTYGQQAQYVYRSAMQSWQAHTQAPMTATSSAASSAPTSVNRPDPPMGSLLPPGEIRDATIAA